MTIVANSPPRPGQTKASISRVATPWWQRLTSPLALATVVPALVAVALTAYQLTRPGFLLGPSADIGVYLGGAVRLVDGAIPYRNFVFVQPPGILVLATPLGLLAKFAGTRVALETLRLLTPALAGVSVVLVGRVISYRGWLPTVIACSVMALAPANFYTLHNGLLESILDVLDMAAFVVVFPQGKFGRPTRLFWGGALFGFAVAVKFPAVLPLVVVACFALRHPRTQWVPLVGGALVGCGVAVLPFFLLVPRAFVQDTVLSQIGRSGGRVPLVARVLTMENPFATALPNADLLAVLVAVVIGGAVLTPFVFSRRRALVEWCALACLVLVGLFQMAPTQYYPQYAAFLSPFFALSLGVGVGAWGGTSRQTLQTWVVASAATLLCGIAISTVTLESTTDPSWAIQSVVPRGACALSPSPRLLVSANRLVSTFARCPPMTDPYGTVLAQGLTSSTADAVWAKEIERVDYIVTTAPIATWSLPPADNIASYVGTNFSLIQRASLDIYVRHGAPVG